MATVLQQLAAIKEDRQLDAEVVELFNVSVIARKPSFDNWIIYKNDQGTLDCFFDGRANAAEIKAQAKAWKAEDAWVRFDEAKGSLVSTNNPWDFINLEEFAHWCALKGMSVDSIGLIVTQDEYAKAREAEIRSWTARR